MKVTFDREVFIFGAGKIAAGSEVDIPESWAAPHLGGDNPRARVGWNLEPVGPDATDAAQELAREQGVDLATVNGTLTDGRIGIEDVRRAIGEG